jgi:acetoin utilization deacetylase AcuC-like enzyme
MGFCLFNNVAVGAAYARKTYGYERIAVVDFDVHHGNGTQSIFERDPGVFFASIHQGLFFPNTGSPDECGVGNIVNVALARGQGSAHFRRGLEEKIFPALRKFAPELILISAGFDAHIADPIGGLRCDNSDFVWVTEEILAIAQACCAGRVVSVLEGGYNPDALASAAAGHIRALMRA